MVEFAGIKIEFGLKDLIRLFNQGKVDKVYEKMYDIAESIAVHEVKQYRDEVYLKSVANKITLSGPQDYVIRQIEFKRKRIDHHMKKMEDLLKLAIEKGSNINKV